MTAEQLTIILKELDFQKPDTVKSIDLNQLIIHMVEHIGSTDPVLRDKLIYSSFYYLTKDGYLTHQQMTYLIQTCLDQNHLFFGIGLKMDDSVFTRAFSSLVAALILDKDREERFLPEETVINAIESSIVYLQREEDTRGYVQEKGWAHSIAHGADLLAEAIKHPLFHLTLANECLHTMGDCILKETAYIDEEDERLIFAIIALLEKGMNEELLIKWLISLSNTVIEIKDNNGFTPAFFRKNTNLNQFLKSLYFRLLFLGKGTQTRKEIEGILKLHLAV